MQLLSTYNASYKLLCCGLIIGCCLLSLVLLHLVILVPRNSYLGPSFWCIKILCSVSFYRSPEVTLELRLEYLSRAIMSAKSCNLRTAASGEGEFLHELEEKLEVARIQMQVYEALMRINAATPSRHLEQALAVLNSRLMEITTVS